MAHGIMALSGPAYLCSVVLLAPFSLFSTAIVNRGETPPPRTAFVDFPMQIDSWQADLCFGATIYRRIALRRLRVGRLSIRQGTTCELLRCVLPIATEGAISPFASKLSAGRRMGDRLLDANGIDGPRVGDATAQGRSCRHSEGGSKANRLVLV